MKWLNSLDTNRVLSVAQKVVIVGVIISAVTLMVRVTASPATIMNLLGTNCSGG